MVHFLKRSSPFSSFSNNIGYRGKLYSCRYSFIKIYLSSYLSVFINITLKKKTFVVILSIKIELLMKAAVAINNANTASEIHQKQISSSFVQSAPFGTISALQKRFPLWVHLTHLAFHTIDSLQHYPIHSIRVQPQEVLKKSILIYLKINPLYLKSPLLLALTCFFSLDTWFQPSALDNWKNDDGCRQLSFKMDASFLAGQ